MLQILLNRSYKSAFEPGEPGKTSNTLPESNLEYAFNPPLLIKAIHIPKWSV